MIYRIRQFFRRLFPLIRPEELDWARSLLSDAAWRLFQKQSAPEQRHALDVAQDLARCAGTLEPRQRRTLLTAALLHDCGKSQVKVKLRHRSLAVLLSYCPAALRSRIAARHATAAFALTIHKQHPLWGHDLSVQAGLDAAVQTLILEHHAPLSRLGKLLREADDRH